MADDEPFRTVFLEPDFRREPKTDCFCCVCQKDIKGEPRFFARIVHAGASAVHPDDWILVPEGHPDDYGVHPVGNDCARRVGREWFATARTPPPAPGEGDVGDPKPRF